MKKKIFQLGIVGAYFVINSVVAQAYELSSTFTLTSDYIYDGESQSGESPAVQGSLDLGFDNGLYVGVWASTIDFEESYGVDGDVEIDFYVGYSRDLNEWLNFDLALFHYAYPGDDRAALNYEEVALTLGYKELFSLGVAYADDDDVWNGKQIRYIASYDQPFLEEWVAVFKLIRTDNEPSFLKDDKWSWKAGLATTWKNVDWELAYWDTDLSDADTFTDIADPRVVFSASYTFSWLSSDK